MTVVNKQIHLWFSSHLTEGWRRVIITLVVFWIIFANFLYFSEVESVRVDNFSLSAADFGSGYSSPVPNWIVYWNKTTPDFIPPLYQSSNESSSLKFGSATSSHKWEYSAVGHILFIGIPIVSLIFIAVIGGWIAEGFNQKNQTVSK